MRDRFDCPLSCQFHSLPSSLLFLDVFLFLCGICSLWLMRAASVITMVSRKSDLRSSERVAPASQQLFINISSLLGGVAEAFPVTFFIRICRMLHVPYLPAPASTALPLPFHPHLILLSVCLAFHRINNRLRPQLLSSASGPAREHLEVNLEMMGNQYFASHFDRDRIVELIARFFECFPSSDLFYKQIG